MSTQTAEPTTRYFVTGGTLSAEAPSYIERAADKALLGALLASRFAYVLNSRQMGKSSLCVRTMKRLEEAGVCTFFVDLTKIGGKTATIEQWYTGIAVELGKTPELRSKILAYWKENSHLGPMQRLFGVLRDVILQFTDQPVSIFFDEIDATRSLSFSADEFFAAIRESYNRRVQDPTYNRLTFCLLGVAVPSDLINSPTSTPFNIGERIYLRDFTLEEAESLAAGLGPNGRALLDRAFYWTNGHPYLTQSLCSAIAADPSVNTPDDVDSLVKRDLFEPTARETNINLADVANRALHAGDLEAEPEKFRADLLSTYDKSRNGKEVPDDEANRVTALLKLSGIMRSEGKRLYVRNRIYEHVFDRDWIRENMPGQELRRQKRAFYLGVLRTGLVALGVVAIITALAINSLRLAHIAAEQRDLAKYEAYAADVNLMRTAYTDNDLILLTNLLQETKDSPNRNIEWNYWNAKLHDANYEIDTPHGFGVVLVSYDGKSVAITDATQQTGAIYTYPDLRLIRSVDHLPTNELIGELGEKWVIVTVSSFSHQQVRDAISDEVLGSFDYGKAGVLTTISPSSGGRYLASGWIASGDRYAQDITVWNGATFQSTHHLKIKGHRISSASVSDDGRYLATEEVSSGSQSIADNYYARRQTVVRDLVTGTEVDSFATGGVPAGFRLSGDGRFLGLGMQTSGTLLVRDVRGHRFILENPTPTVVSMIFSADDTKLLTVGDDLAACLWDLKSGKLIDKKEGAMAASMPRDASSLIVSGAGSRVYTSANVTTDSSTVPNSWANLRGINDKGWLVINTGNALRFLDPSSLKPVHPTLRSVAPLISISADANWRLDPLPTGGKIVNNGTDRVLCAISTWNALGTAMDVVDGRTASIDSNSKAICYDRSGKELWHYDFKTSPATCCRWSPDGTILAVSTRDGQVHFLNADNGALIRTLVGYDTSIQDLLFSHDSKRIAVVGNDFKVLIFYVTGDKPAVLCRGHHALVEYGAFSPDDTRFASASDDGTVRFWDPKTGKQMLQIDVGKVPATGIAFDPSGERFYISDYAGTIRRYLAPKT